MLKTILDFAGEHPIVFVITILIAGCVASDAILGFFRLFQ